VAEEIQLLACGYSGQCSVRGCRAPATRLRRYTDNQGRPRRQRELCERMRIGSSEPADVRDLMGRDERARELVAHGRGHRKSNVVSRAPQEARGLRYIRAASAMGFLAGWRRCRRHSTPSRRRRISIERCLTAFPRNSVRPGCVTRPMRVLRAALSYGHRIDHIVPRARSGSDRLSNLQLLCPFCNALKGDQTDGEFRVYFAQWRCWTRAGRPEGFPRHCRTNIRRCGRWWF